MVLFVEKAMYRMQNIQEMDKRNPKYSFTLFQEKQLSVINMNWSVVTKPKYINFIGVCISIFKKNYSSKSIELTTMILKYFIFIHRTG